MPTALRWATPTGPGGRTADPAIGTPADHGGLPRPPRPRADPGAVTVISRHQNQTKRKPYDR
eukprot:6478173-Prymnesium_polylepis.1